MTQNTRTWLRDVPVLTGNSPAVDIAAIPTNPVDMFQQWLHEAVDTGVPEPHAMVVSTVDEHAAPDARVLTLKDFGDHGWAFATTKSSVQGQQLALAVRPHVALTFWWQPLVRSVRIRGEAVEASREESLLDLRARSESAQQSVEADDWTVWHVVPSRIEFWQGSTQRQHLRCVFVRHGDAWQLDL